MAVNKLNSLMKTMAEKAGLDNSHLRATALENEWFKHWMIRIFLLVISCSYQDTKMCRVLTTTVMFHKEQQKSTSRILSCSTSMVQTETHSLVETTKQQSPTPTAAGLFRGAVFYGGNFTININSSSSLTETHKQQTYQRIKRHIWLFRRQRQSTFAAERASFVEKLSTYFVELFLLFIQYISWMSTYEKLIRCYEIVML